MRGRLPRRAHFMTVRTHACMQRGQAGSCAPRLTRHFRGAARHARTRVLRVVDSVRVCVRVRVRVRHGQGVIRLVLVIP